MDRGMTDARATDGEATMSAGTMDRRRAGWRRLRRGPQEDRAGGHRSESQDAVASLQAEVALLREENRRLSAQSHMPADPGRVTDLVAAVSARAEDREAAGDEAAELLTEGLVLRDSLIEMCAEIKAAMTSLEARLQAFVADEAERGDRRPPNPDGGVLLQLPTDGVAAGREGWRVGERA